MARSCVITRDNKKRVADVRTRSGQFSTLYDKIASIPLMENKERAVSLFKTVYSKSFIKAFGNWLTNTPNNLKAYKAIKNNIKVVPENQRQAILDKAAKMDNPLVITTVKPRENIEEDGFSFYSTDIKEGDSIFLVDTFTPTDIKVDDRGSNTSTEVTNVLKMDFTPVVNLTVGDNNYVVVRDGLKVFSSEELLPDSSQPGLSYENGEPRLFFVTDDNTVFEDYGEALRHGGKEIRIGFISGVAQDSDSGIGTSAVVKTPSGIILNNPDAFIPLMSASTSTSIGSVGGMINYLIKKGLISGSKVYNTEDGSYYLMGYGHADEIRLFNSARAHEFLCNTYGAYNVTMNDRGMIRIKSMDTKRVSVVDSNGKTSKIDKEQLKAELRSGNYTELAKKYEHFDALVLSLILEDNSLYQDRANPFVNYKQEEVSQRNSIIEILKSLGVDVIGMADYIAKYKTKHGYEPSAKALADIANNVIAISEDATIEDVAEETAHFLVEAYKDQGAISAILNQVEGTEEWNTYAQQYYDVYKDTYEGQELDEAVRREIIGKILAKHLGDKVGLPVVLNSIQTEPQGLVANVMRLINGIRSWLKSAITTQKQDLQNVIENIRDLALSDISSGFDTNLLRDNDFVLYSLSDMNKNQFLENKIRSLKMILRDLRSVSSDRSVTASMSLSQLKTIEDKINDVTKEISRSEMASAMNGMIDTASAQVRFIKTVVDDILKQGGKDGKLHFNVSDKQNVEIINRQVKPLLESLRGYIKNRNSDFTKEEKQRYTDRIDDIIADISSIKSDIDSVLDLDQSSLVDRLINYLHIPQDHVDTISKYFDKVQKDVSALSRWFGILEHSSIIQNNALGALIARDNYNAMTIAQPKIAKFMNEVKKDNWDVKQFENLLQTVEGKQSKYLRSAINYAKFEQDYKINQMKVLKDMLGLDDLTDERIKEIVTKNLSYEIKIPGLTGKTESFRFKPSMERVNHEFLTVAQEKEFSDKMREWIEENTEQPYTESYSKKREAIYEAAEKELGYKISDTTKEFLNSISRQKYALKKPFYDAEGNFDYVAYALSSNHEEVGLLMKHKKEAASDKVFIGGRYVDKDGQDAIMAKEIQAINKAWQAEFEKNKTDNVKAPGVSQDFLDTIAEIQSQSRGNMSGSKAAFLYLSHGGHFSFSDSFWSDAGFDRSARTESNNNALYSKLAKDIKETTVGNDDIVDNLVKSIEDRKRIIKEIVGNNRDLSNIGEINLATFTEGEEMAFREASESIEESYSALMMLAKDAGLDVGSYLERSSVSENEVNESYKKALADSGLPEWEFAAKHTTSKKAEKIRDLYRKMRDGEKNYRVFTPSETAFLSEQLGIDAALPKGKFRDEVNKRAAQYKIQGDDPISWVNIYARNQVFSYYKRMAPDGYSMFLELVDAGKIDMVKLIQDLQNGTSSQNYMMDISYLKFEPNREWLEEGESKEDKNPNYIRNHGYGRYLPKKDHYEDLDYVDYFGITYDNEGKEIAKSNLKEYNMIQNLKKMMTESLDEYKEQGRNIYQIPQISKDSIEKVRNLGTTHATRSIRTMVSDLFLDRVDDSIYGNTQQGDNRDIDDRPRAIPKYYINEYNNQDDVSHDLAWSYSMLTMQSALYDQKQNTVELALGLEQSLLSQQFNGGRVPESTQAYRMFKDFLNSHYFGVHMNTRKMVINVKGYPIDITRFLTAAERMMTTMNLALSPFVAATGALTGQANILIESAVGQYITPSSSKFAVSEVSRLMPEYVSEIGDISRNSKLRVVGERLGIYSLQDRVFGAGFDRAARTALREPMYAFMEIATSPLKPQVMVGVLDNYRYYKPDDPDYPERFYTFKEFKALQERAGKATTVKQDWDRLQGKTLWNMIDVKDGEMVVREGAEVSIDEIESQIAMARNQVRSLAQIVDGSLNDENRIGATRNLAFKMLIAHRGWLTIAAERLWKKRGFNFQTMQEEEGMSRSFVRMVKNTFALTTEKGFTGLLQAYKDNYKQMDEVEKSNIKRLGVYAGVFAIMQAVSMILAGFRDDDDRDSSWVTQFGTYIGFRTINEIASQMPLLMEMNFVDVMNDPVVVARKIKDLTDVSNYFGTVTSGAYKGESKLWRQLAKQTFIKQWYNVKTPKDIARASQWWQQTNKKSMMFFWDAIPENKTNKSNNDEEFNYIYGLNYR